MIKKIERIKLKTGFVNLMLGISQSDIDLEKISAVFLIGIKSEMILAVRNERGWDIPGGHIESKDVDLYSALKREVYEEAGATLKSAKPFALMHFGGEDKSMLFYVSDNFDLSDDFVAKEDAFERKMMSIPEFLKKYNWEKKVIEKIIEFAFKN
jgi:8-oxo-dGTP pyrophosphatase MutT (NUDIX family)